MTDAKDHATRVILVLATAVSHGHANFAVAREFKIVIPQSMRLSRDHDAVQ